MSVFFEFLRCRLRVKFDLVSLLFVQKWMAFHSFFVLRWLYIVSTISGIITASVKMMREINQLTFTGQYIYNYEV